MWLPIGIQIRFLEHLRVLILDVGRSIYSTPVKDTEIISEILYRSEELREKFIWMPFFFGNHHNCLSLFVYTKFKCFLYKKEASLVSIFHEFVRCLLWIFLYLKVRAPKGDLLPTNLLPKCLQQARFSQVDTRSPGLHLHFTCGWQGSKYLCQDLHLPYGTSRKLAC